MSKLRSAVFGLYTHYIPIFNLYKWLVFVLNYLS